ncbi:hypothetical protein SGPA1_41183 [Streptomyces misionensis JCM 4497]
MDGGVRPDRALRDRRPRPRPQRPAGAHRRALRADDGRPACRLTNGPPRPGRIEARA